MLVCGFIFCGVDVSAQIHADKKIQFDTAATQNRTIEGVVLAYDSTSGVPHSAFIQTSLNYISNQTGTSVLLINLATPMTAYPVGFELFIKSANANPGALFLNVNSIGAVEVKKHDSTSLVANEIVTNQIFKVIYNGTYFMMQNPSNLKCPAGFVNVNDNFCIETVERSSTLYLNAVSTCYSLNGRLCTWGEWYYVCKTTGTFGALGMTTNYEFLDDTSDHKNTVLVAGRDNCEDFYANLITAANVYTFRCCYNK